MKQNKQHLIEHGFHCNNLIKTLNPHIWYNESENKVVKIRDSDDTIGLIPIMCSQRMITHDAIAEINAAKSVLWCPEKDNGMFIRYAILIR